MKIVVCGDVEGRFAATFGRVAKIDAANGPFDALLCCGRFLGEDGSLPPGAPIPTYFIEGPPEWEAGRVVADGVTYLGSEGIKSVFGRSETHRALTVAFASKCASGKQVAEAAKKTGFMGADVLLTSDWPRGIDAEVDEKTIGIMRDRGVYLNALGTAAPRLAAEACRARYHFSASHDIYWVRQPYRLIEGLGPGTTRFVALAKAAFSKEKAKKWLHAIDIEPIPYCDGPTLKAEPIGTTDSPWTTNARPQDWIERSVDRSTDPPPKPKRRRVETMAASSTQSSTLFVGGIPPYVTADRLSEIVASAGETSVLAARVTNKGYAFLDFPSAEEAKRAKDNLGGGRLSVDGKALSVEWAKPTKHKHLYPDDQRTECWFCLASPSCETHLVVCVGPSAYVAMPKGPLCDSHALVVSIDHRSHLQDTGYAAALARCFATSRQRDEPIFTVAFERFAPTKKGVYHAHLQVVPVPGDKDTVLHTFNTAAAQAGFQLSTNSSSSSEAWSGSSVSAEVPYFKCYVYDASGTRVASLINTGSRVPLHFGRSVCAKLLGKSIDMAHWKACQLDVSSETALCEQLKHIFAPFDPYPANDALAVPEDAPRDENAGSASPAPVRSAVD